MNKTFRIYNFGCKVNQEEGSALAALFLAQGWQQGENDAALYIINTCTVTQTADKKDRNLIRRLRREHPQALLAVCGCYAQRQAETCRELGADIVCGVDERRRLPQLVEEYYQSGQPLTQVSDISAVRDFHPIGKGSDQTRARAYVKIEDGCNQFCNYCIVPHVRGPVRSLPIESVLMLSRDLIAAGHQELVLTGVHIGAYGSDLPGNDNLPRLIQELCALPGLLRLRLGSIEPQQFTPQLIDTLAAVDKLCPHLHIPLQSGCDKTLSAMGRCYDTAAYARLLQTLRDRLGDIAIATDIMAGYPGESAADHQDSLTFCQDMGFADMHVFPYSRRSGTPAAQAPGQVTQALKTQRAAELAEAAAELSIAYRSRYIGHTLTLLAEEYQDGWLKGHSGNYILLYVPASLGQPGQALSVKAQELFIDGLSANISINHN